MMVVGSLGPADHDGEEPWQRRRSPAANPNAAGYDYIMQCV